MVITPSKNIGKPKTMEQKWLSDYKLWGIISCISYYAMKHCPVVTQEAIKTDYLGYYEQYQTELSCHFNIAIMDSGYNVSY